jgi:hypothetical protein
MHGYAPLIMAIGALWAVGCFTAFAVVLLRTLARRKSAGSTANAWPFLTGLFLIGLAPVVSAIGAGFTHAGDLWDGAGVLVVGLALIAFGPYLKARRERSNSRPAATTFREKSLIVQIAAILVVYGYYGVRLWGPVLLTPVGAVVALISVTAAMIAINVAAHAAIALYAGVDRGDERDRAIALKGARNGYYAFGAGWFAIVVLVIAHAPYALLFLAVMGVFALAELVRYGSALAYYRLGV